MRAASVPWSILPAAEFYWLYAKMLDTVANRRVWPLPANLDMQPCDSAEFAGYVVACLNQVTLWTGAPVRMARGISATSSTTPIK